MTGVHQVIAGGRSRSSLRRLIDRNALATSLNAVIDAGDASCYRNTTDAFPQTLFDASGNNNNYFRGDGVNTGSQPTFNGSIGGFGTGNTYFSFDGQGSTGNLDHFRETTDQTYAHGWHKDNAAFTIVYVCWLNSVYPARNLGFFSNDGNGLGVRFAIDASQYLYISRALNNFGFNQDTYNTSWQVVSGSRWEMFAVSFSEATTTAIFRQGSLSNTITGLASSTATNDANAPNDISRGLPGSTEYHNPSDRFACTAHWSRALSNAELTSLYNDLKLNFPGMG